MENKVNIKNSNVYIVGSSLGIDYIGEKENLYGWIDNKLNEFFRGNLYEFEFGVEMMDYIKEGKFGDFIKEMMCGLWVSECGCGIYGSDINKIKDIKNYENYLRYMGDMEEEEIKENVRENIREILIKGDVRMMENILENVEVLRNWVDNEVIDKNKFLRDYEEFLDGVYYECVVEDIRRIVEKKV